MGANITRVQRQHQEIAALAKEIQQHASTIVTQAKEMGYDPSNPQICQKLAFTYRDKLNQFNRSTLVQMSLNVGLAASPDDLKNINKQQICDIIVGYYRRKVDLVMYIENAVEGSCRNTERQIAANMEQMLEGAPQRVQNLAYQRLVSLNGAVQTLFERADSALQFILDDNVLPEVLERYVTQAFAQIDQDKVNCCRRAHALRQFAYIPVTVGNSIKYRNIYTDEVVDVLPRIDQIEPELPINMIPC